MNGKEKLYFLLERIIDARDTTPSGQPLIIDPTNDLNRNYRELELLNLFTKLEKDEQVLTILKIPRRVREIEAIENLDPYEHADDGCWHIELLPSFDAYYLKIQHEPEYQEFTGKKPPTPIRTSLSRKSLEKIWTVLQEIEDKRGITPTQDDISIPFVHFSKVKDEIGAINASDERRNILRKLENEEQAIKDVRFPDKLNQYVYLKVGTKYFEVSDYYEKEYKKAAKSYQQEQALRPTFFSRNTINQPEKATPREIVNEFSSQNYSFVEMVLKSIALLVEFSSNNEVSYQLQSPPGQMLIQERALLKKLEAKGLFKNAGEDGIFGIATLKDIDTELLKQLLVELDMKSSGLMSKEEFEEIKAKYKYDKLVEEITKPTSPSLQEQYDTLLSKIRPKQEENSTHEEIIKPTQIDETSKPDWQEDFVWKSKDFVFGTYGTIHFNSEITRKLFRELTEAKGGWVTVRKLREVTGKNDDYVRPTIGQVERRMKKELRKYISFPSTEEDILEPMPSQGAYRIKFTPKPL